jgi:hypothetical protein
LGLFVLFCFFQPILMVDLDMKQLVIEAYHNGQQEMILTQPLSVVWLRLSLALAGVSVALP